ncbi:MAG: hypothetical protein NUV82_03580 [Candidatus Komeilibacteria bacterium]|nr:hypothetical protein [Candidatus Komeilibacteria bacterium]
MKSTILFLVLSILVGCGSNKQHVTLESEADANGTYFIIQTVLPAANPVYRFYRVDSTGKHSLAAITKHGGFPQIIFEHSEVRLVNNPVVLAKGVEFSPTDPISRCLRKKIVEGAQEIYSEFSEVFFEVTGEKFEGDKVTWSK